MPFSNLFLVGGQTNFGNRIQTFLTSYCKYNNCNMYIALEVKLQIGTNDLDVEPYTNKLKNTLQSFNEKIL